MKEQDEQKRLEQATELREQELIKHSAFQLWHDLKDKLKEMAGELNHHYGQEYLMVLPDRTPEILFVQSRKRKVEMRFDNKLPQITFSPSFEDMGSLRFGVERREVIFAWDGVRFSLNRTAEIILDKFV
jgi:hypothetical protein